MIVILSCITGHGRSYTVYFLCSPSVLMHSFKLCATIICEVVSLVLHSALDLCLQYSIYEYRVLINSLFIFVH